MTDTNLDLAPPVAVVDGLTAVPIDIQRISAKLIFDGATSSGRGDATLDVTMGTQDGNPVFDLRQTLNGAWLDGASLPVDKLAASKAPLVVPSSCGAPGVPIEWAVRMSMSVPLLWEEVVWQDAWGTYRGHNVTGHSVVDGGLLSNFPLALLISRDPKVIELMGVGDANVVGFLIDEGLEVKDAPAAPLTPLAGSRAIRFAAGYAPIKRLKGLADTATQAHDRAAIDDYERLVVRLPAKTYGTTEFEMTDERREALIASGYATTAAYFAPPSADQPPATPAALDMAAIDRQARRIVEE